jgi:glycosyltransferase involved in cell wall biosynthesis
MENQEQVTILMATYNGAAYLAQQLDSILSQTYSNWKLVIRDDGSTDQTLAIITSYLKNDERISLVYYGENRGSACTNFSQLSDWALANEAGIVMFADQDDIWKNDKVAVSVASLLAMQEEYGAATPLLCYSTFQFINEKNEPLPQKLALPSSLELRVLLNENHAWGCTMILNQAALKAISPIPATAVNHDYWIALVISALGKTKLINQDLILYRQHTSNVSGNVDNMSFAKRFNRYIADQSYMTAPLTANLNTIALFYARYKDQLTVNDKAMVSAFISGYQKGFFPLLSTLFKYKIFKLGTAKNAAYFYTLFLLRKNVIAQANLYPQP